MSFRNIDIELLQNAVENAVTGVVIADVNQDDAPLIYVNQAFVNMTGYSKEEVVGKNCRFLQNGENNQEGVVKIRKAMRNGTECKARLRNYRKDGTLFWNELTISPVHNENNELTHFIGIQDDVTDKVKAENRIKALQEKTENANQSLTAFNAAVSHDLKSPLRHISMFASMLEGHTDQSDASKEYLNYINDSIRKMTTLIEDLLEFSKSDSAVLNKKVVDLQQLVEFQIKPLLEEYKAANPSVEVDSLPRVKVDKVLIRQVFYNLIHNALKYSSKQGNPIINVGVEEDVSHWTFKVSDNGIGFKAESAKKIFEPFVRLHSTNTYEGTGIGLANVYRIVEKHGGRIWAESLEGEGATFYFTLPK